MTSRGNVRKRNCTQLYIKMVKPLANQRKETRWSVNKHKSKAPSTEPHLTRTYDAANRPQSNVSKNFYARVHGFGSGHIALRSCTWIIGAP
jgi:hypothetical protein